MPRQLKHPNYYYSMRDEIIALMDDQAGRPFDATNFRIQFPKVAARHKVPRGTYWTHFYTIERMVAAKLPKMKPRQPSLV